MSDRKIYDISELRHIETWIVEIWELFLNSLEEKDLISFFKEIKEYMGENTSSIIDNMYSADKLHYKQNGNTSSLDTYNFIENFEDIKNEIYERLLKYK